MALDERKVSFSTALTYAKQYYPQDKYEHALRVMQYVAENELIPAVYKDDCLILAIMHDLVEDTPFVGTALPENTYKSLMLLTKPKGKDYIEYIKELKDECDTCYGICAWWVKLADMKDHLAQTETLTEKLRDKYLAALPYLL